LEGRRSSGERVAMALMTGIVFDIKKFSIHDGPGIRTTVFLKGCPLSCWWCHNPEGQAERPELILRPERCIGCGVCLDICGQDAITCDNGRVVTDRARCTACGVCAEACYAAVREIVGREMSVTEVVDEIERDAAFYEESGGGVTFSGGEPLSQPDFLSELLRASKARGLSTALDTCGFGPWGALDRLREDVDLFLYDLKLMDDARHRALTGVSNKPILRNLERLSRCGHRIVIRVPIIPGLNDDGDNLREIGAFAVHLPSVEYVELLSYHRIGRDKYRRLGKSCPMLETDPPTVERMTEIARILRSSGLVVSGRIDGASLG
jgi:pyruvate formate lyase activating enzyme